MKKLKNFIRVLFAMIIAFTLAGGGEIVEAADPNSIVIWEVYGGGGNGSSEYANDYVVLKNISEKTQSVDGMYLHKGTTSVLSDKNVELSGTIRPGGYYVFAGQKGQGSNSDNATVPYARKTATTFDLSKSDFTVTLTNGKDASKKSNIVDMLGAGKARNFRVKAAPATSNTYSLRRKDFTGNNRSDFELISHSRAKKNRVLSYLTEENATEDEGNDASEDATVTIDPNGGEIKEYYLQKIVPLGKAYKILPRNVVDLKRDGYKFNGYDVIGTLLDKDGNKVSTIDNLYNQELRPVGDVTLKARWVEFEGGKLSFEFKFDDGSQFDSTKYQVLLVNLDDQRDIKILQSKNRTKTATGVKAGKYSVKVSGLANDESVKEFTKGSAYGNSGSTSSVKYIDGQSGELTIEFDEEVTDPKAYYYINLEKNIISQTYKLTFDYQNENQANKSSEVDSSLPVAINAPEAREGYKFLGYDVEGKLLDSNKNEITERFLPGSEEYCLASDVKLTAVWQEVLPEESTVTIDPNAGEMLEDKAKTVVKTGDAYTTDFEGNYKFYKDGYHFDGFDVIGDLEDKDGNKVEYIKRANPFTEYYPKGDVTLKVRWKVMQAGQFRAYVKRDDDTAFGGQKYKLYLKASDSEERKFPYGVTSESQTHKMSLLQLKNDSYTLRVEGLADDEFIKEVRVKEDKSTQNQADTKIELIDRDKAKIEIKYDSHFIAPEVNFDVIIGKKPVEETYTFTLTGEGVNEINLPGFTRKTAINLKAVEREGYKFLGWSVEGTLFDEEGTPVTGLITNFDQSYYPGSDVVFTAVWEKDIPEAEKASLIIYEVFGGGGKTGSLYANDYVVIKNTGEQPVNLDGMVLRKGLSNRWTDQSVLLSGELAPGAFYVVSGGNDNEADGGERPVPAVDLEDENFNFANRTFSLALTTDDNLPSKDNTIDLVGTGKARNFEGKQAATGRNNVSLRRINDGQDTDNNRDDFARIEHLRDADTYPLAYLGDKDLRATVTFEFDKNIDGAKLPDPITVKPGTEIELPKLDEEVLGDYSFMGWELDKAYPNKADANPGDTITVTEDMTVKGYWEGRYGRFAVHFYEGDYFENKENLQTLTEGFGFATINPIDKTRLEGILAGENSKNPYFITPNKAQGGGLTKDAYDLEFTIPEGYKIVSIDKKLADGGLEQVNIGERISPYWYPFNLTMPRGVYVQVEKEEPKIELPEGLYIYEIYGGGGLQQSYYANDYVVLQNKSNTDIDLAGINLHVSKQWRPEYAYNIPLSGTIKANDYFVIKAGAGFKSGEQKDLPRVDLDLSGEKLYQNDFDYQAIGLALTKGSEEPNEKNTIDMVGTYNKNRYLVKPATSPHVDSSIRRVAYDDVNRTDFTNVSHRPYIAGTADHREPLWYLKDSQEEKVTVSFAHNVELANNETPAEQNVWSGTKITLPKVKEEENYEFKGWDVDGDDIADKQAGEEFEVKENVTIKGIWEEEKPEVKTINFVVDPEKGSATGSLSAEVIEGEDPIAKAPKVEAKEGYNFVRWEASEDGLTYTAIFEEVEKPVELIRDNSIKFEVLEPFEGDTAVLVTTSQADDLVVIEVNGNEVLRKASNQANVEEWYEINQAVKKNDKVSVYIVRNNQFKSSIINKRVVE